MKKIALIIATVVVLIGATYFADRATRLPVRTDTGVVKADSPSTGELEPQLTLKDLNGNDVSLSQFKGKVVLVNFWATWCEPCRVEIPWLIQLQQKYGPRGFEVVGIALDDEGKSAVAPFVAKERFDVDGHQLPMSYEILIGNDDAADKFGGLFGYPTSILISKDGKQLKRITGIIDYDEISKDIEGQL